MDIHEYQAKALLAEFGMPIARGGLAYSPEQAAYRAMELGGEKWVVKAANSFWCSRQSRWYQSLLNRPGSP